MANEKSEKLKQQQYVAEKKLTAAKHKEKRLEKHCVTRKIPVTDTLTLKVLTVAYRILLRQKIGSRQ